MAPTTTHPATIMPSKYPAKCGACGKSIPQAGPIWYRGSAAPKGRRVYCASLACIPHPDHPEALALDGKRNDTQGQPIRLDTSGASTAPAPAYDPSTGTTAPAPQPAPSLFGAPRMAQPSEPEPSASTPQPSANGQHHGTDPLAQAIAAAVAPYVAGAVDADQARAVARQELAHALRRLRRAGAAEGIPEPVTTVPSADPRYLAGTQTGDLIAATLSTDTHAFVSGPSGSGKTYPIVQECARAGRTLLLVSASEGMDRSALLGQWVLERSKSGGQPAMRWSYGPLPRAMASGAVLCIDEADKLSPALTSILFGVTDPDPNAYRSLYIPENGQTIDPAPGFIVYCTGNVLRDDGGGGYSGQRPDGALLTRLQHIPADYMTVAQERAILAHLTTGPRAQAIAEALSRLRKLHERGGLSTPPSLRAGRAVAQALEGRAPNGRPYPGPLTWDAAWTLALLGSLTNGELDDARKAVGTEA